MSTISLAFTANHGKTLTIANVSATEVECLNIISHVGCIKTDNWFVRDDISLADQCWSEVICGAKQVAIGPVNRILIPWTINACLWSDWHFLVRFYGFSALVNSAQNVIYLGCDKLHYRNVHRYHLRSELNLWSELISTNILVVCIMIVWSSEPWNGHYGWLELVDASLDIYTARFGFAFAGTTTGMYDQYHPTSAHITLWCCSLNDLGSCWAYIPVVTIHYTFCNILLEKAISAGDQAIAQPLLAM